MVTKKEKMHRNAIRDVSRIDSETTELEKCIFIVSIAYLKFKGEPRPPKDRFARTLFRRLESRTRILKVALPVVANIMKNISTNAYEEIVDYIIELNVQEVAAFIEEYLYVDAKRTYSNATSSKSINDLLVNLANIKTNDAVLDPSCGIGGTLLTIVKNNPQQLIYGQDTDPVCITIAKLLLDISGSENYHLFVGDSLSEPKYLQDEKLIKFDAVVTEPPFVSQFEKSLNDKDSYDRFTFGTVPLKKADWGFVMNAINSSKNESGRSVVLLPTGSLFRGGSEGEIRHNILKKDLFEAIISLPSGVLPSSSIPTSIMIFDRNKPIDRKNKMLFIKVSKDDIVRVGRGPGLTTESVEKIVSTARNLTEIENYSLVLSNDQISADSMMVDRYIKKTMYHFDNHKYYIDLVDFYGGNTIPLKNISKIDRGYNMISKNENEDGKYQIMKISDIDGESINYNEMSRGDVEERTKVDNYEIEDGDVIMAVRGTFKILTAQNVKPNTLINSNLVRLRVNPKLYDSDFLKYFIKSPVGRAQLENITMGTTVRQIPIKPLNMFQLPNLTLVKQKKIVKHYLNQTNDIQIKINELEKLKRKNNQDLYQKMGLDDLYQVDGGENDDL
jgi:Type I restriction-modification system methyltransferase subunit